MRRTIYRSECSGRSACLLIVCIGVATVVGCGGRGDRPQLGRVSGTITLDDTPVVDARVIFRPVEGGRSSKAVTDEQGYYTLYYDNEPGASVGRHIVKISTYRSGASGPGRAEQVPKKYNTESTLEVEVNRGDQKIDLPLEDVPGERKRQPIRGPRDTD